MGARTATFLCLASIAGAVVVSKVKRHNATGARVGPKEAVAVRELSNAAESITKAALDDAMALGTTRALEDVRQLARVAQAAAADELGVSTGQSQEEDAGEMARKSILAAATVAESLAEAHLDAVDSTGDTEEKQEEEEASEEARMESRVQQILDSSDSSDLPGNLADFAAQEAARYMESEIEDRFGPEVLDMDLQRDSAEPEKRALVRMALDQLSQVTSRITLAAKEMQKEGVQGQEASVCGPRMVPFVAFHVRTPAVCDNYCVPEGSCWIDVSKGSYRGLGIAKQGTCSRLGFTMKAVFAEPAPEFFQAFVGNCAGMQMTKWMKSPAGANASAKTDSLSQDVLDQVTAKVVGMAEATADSVRELRATLDDTGGADSSGTSGEDPGASEGDAGPSGTSGEDPGASEGVASLSLGKVMEGVKEIAGAVGSAVKLAGEISREPTTSPDGDSEEEHSDMERHEEVDSEGEEALEGKKQGASDDEDAGGVAGKVLEGVGEIVDAVAPVVADVIDAVAEDDEEVDSEGEEALEVKQQGASDDEDAGGVAGKVLEGIGEIVDAVAPVVADVIDAVAAVAEDDEEEDEE